MQNMFLWEHSVLRAKQAVESDPYRVPALVRGLQALQCFTPTSPELSLTEIAAALGVTRSAAFRTVHTLQSQGYLLATGNGGKFRLGPSVLRLTYGYHASRELLEIARPPLEKLRNDTDWSTHLGVLDGKHVLYLERFPATGGLSSLVHVGSRLPAASTAMGRIFIANREESAIRKMYSDLDQGSIHKILRGRELDQSQPFVESVGRFESGLCSIAAGIRDMSGAVIAAISATQMTSNVPGDIPDRVLHAADAISIGLGFKME